MARPRKDSGQPEAKQRLIDAFWTLLESNHLHDITVGMITAEAHCNRGTFYYHYADIDALVYNALRELLLDGSGVAATIFEMLAGSDADGPLLRAALDDRFKRFSLIMHEGEMRRVDAMVQSIMTDMWQTTLCREGEQLTPEARLIVKHATSGMLSIMTCTESPEDHRANLYPGSALRSYLREASLLTVACLCRAQGMAPREFADRLQAHGGRVPLTSALAANMRDVLADVAKRDAATALAPRDAAAG